MTDIDLTDSRAERVQPRGFVPSHLATPMLRDRDAQATALEYTANTLGEVRAAADILASPVEDDEDPKLRARLAEFVSTETGRLQRLVKALAVGALALLIAAGVTLGGGGRAEAAEAPQPDPAPVVSVAARTVQVVLSAPVVTARIPVTTTHVTPTGRFCASVWGPTSYGQGFLGRACSPASSFTVPVVLDARYVPLGRSTLRYTDDVAPMDSPVGTVTLVARRPSMFGWGVWTPTYWGDGLTVTAPLYAYTPALGAWTVQRYSPVQVQEFVDGRWVVRATLWTDSRGIARGSVLLGGGLHTVRVARPVGATVTATVGTAHTFYLIPTDVPIDVI